MAEFYVVRYLPEVDLNKRAHGFTLGRFPTWLDAEAHRTAQPVAELLTVEGPREQVEGPREQR